MDNAAIRALTLMQVRDALAAGELTSEAVVGAAIEQAERFKDEYGLFMTFLPEAAREQARAADQARAAGKPLGPLHGVPFHVKDNIEYGGVRSSAGSKVLEDYKPAQDATAVASVRAAGGISIGQTMCVDLVGGWGYVSPFFPPVRNPWNPALMPGGSSSGAAAAIALRVGYAGLGTDSGGSVRNPASLCGLVGLKATHGAISVAGLIPTGPLSVDHIGPIVRTVADARLMFSVLAAYDPRDCYSSDRLLAPHPALSSLTGYKIGVPENYFWEDLDPEIEAVCRGQLELMRAAGAELAPVRFETIGTLKDAAPILNAEAWLFHEPYVRAHPERYTEPRRSKLLESCGHTAVDYASAMHIRQAYVLEMRNALRKVDALVMPTSYIPAQSLEEVGGREINISRNRMPFNQAGAPAINIPAGVHSNGAPFGLQLAALHFTDYKLLSMAEFVEGLTGFDTIPPILRPVAAGV